MTESALTPSQTVGPYGAIGLLRVPTANELVDPGEPRAVRIQGRLTDGAGEGVPDGMVELWQANAAGRYRHPADDREDVPLEDGFLGFGRAGTDDDGRFEFVTVKPGRVPWPEGGLQAPHALVAVFARGLLKHVVTRLYFPDEVEANAERSGALVARGRRALDARRRRRGRRPPLRHPPAGAGQTTFFAV